MRLRGTSPDSGAEETFEQFYWSLGSSRGWGCSGVGVESENAFVPLLHKTGPFVQLGGTLFPFVKGNR